MKNVLKLMLKQYFLPKWIVLLYDLAVIGTVFAFSTYLVANFSAEQAELQNAIRQVIASTLIFLIVYLIIKPQDNISYWCSWINRVRNCKEIIAIQSGKSNTCRSSRICTL